MTEATLPLAGRVAFVTGGSRSIGDILRSLRDDSRSIFAFFWALALRGMNKVALRMAKCL